MKLAGGNPPLEVIPTEVPEVVEEVASEATELLNVVPAFDWQTWLMRYGWWILVIFGIILILLLIKKRK